LGSIACTGRPLALFRLPKYDDKAVARLRHFLDLSGGLSRTHHYVMESPTSRNQNPELWAFPKGNGIQRRLGPSTFA